MTLDDEYPKVSVNLKITSPREINYWFTRFILQVMKKDGTACPVNSLHLLACRLVRHFRDELKRFDLNILSKDEPNFDSFRKALDSRMKEMSASGIGTKKQPADPLCNDDEAKLWSTGTVGLMSSKSLSYGMFSYNCKVFGFRTMNEHINLMEEQYEFRADQEGEFLHFTGRLCKNVLGGLQ